MPSAPTMIRMLFFRNVAAPSTITVSSGRSALKSAKNSVNRGMT